MKRLLEAINRGILRGLNENNIELLADLDDDTADQLDTLQSKSFNNDESLRFQLLIAIKTKKIHAQLKDAINNPKNYYKFNGLIKAKNNEHLKELIEIGQQLFGDDGNFNWIDTSEITNMPGLFFHNSNFNGHIELWDVSNVTNMHHMFTSAKKFNQPIGNWNVSNVTNMLSMFANACEFNQPINNWNVSNVTNMTLMFCHANKFNQPIGDWDVSNVTAIRGMFDDAQAFNQDISNWDIKNAEQSLRRGIHSMFSDCPIKQEFMPHNR